MHPGTNESVNEGVKSTVQFAKIMLDDLPIEKDIVIENILNSKNAIGTNMNQLKFQS